jgi:CheY-like chemotaxis protein
MDVPLEVIQMKEKILIVNDDDAIRDITKMILEAKGYELAEAVNGRLALAEAASFKPDLILLDIMMPEMDGFEACQRLKENVEMSETPILFFSS